MAKSTQPEHDGGTGGDHPNARSWFGDVADDADDELLGAVLSGSYRVVRVLGEGAMGRVYEAEHTRLSGKRFAVKVLHHELMRHKQVNVRFEREAEAMSLLNHRNIVGVFDVDHAPDGRPYMVCEYLDGQELGEYLDEVGKVSLAVAVNIARQLCRALMVAHGSGVTHRDMKPENVFLVGEDRKRPLVKVLDFGLARLESAAGDSLTQAGTIMGTPAYMAPEQARGSRVDNRADVYAVGAIVYRMLTGQKPFEREDARATLGAVLTEEPPRPRAVEPAISEDVELVIQQAMARDPAERYQSAEALDQGLAQLVDRAQPQQAQSTRPPPRGELPTLTAFPPYSRATLVVMLIVTALWTLAILSSGAVSAVELLMERGPGEVLTVSELGLVVATLCAALVTPIALYTRQLRDKVWNNSLKVTRAISSLRMVLFASMAAYGGAALTVRVVDAVLSRLVNMTFATSASALAWPGWPITFVLVGLFAAGAAALSRRLLQEEPASRTRRIVAGPLLASAATLVSAGVMYAAFVMRSEVPATATGASPEVAAAAEPSVTASAAVADGSASVTAAATASTSVQRASAGELTRAQGAGAPALAALAKKYPDDGAVMKALVQVYANDKNKQLLALHWTGLALKAQPDLATWKTLRALVLRSAQSGEPASSRALDIMASKMGSDGPDLLYDLMIAGNKSVRERAQTLLAHREVRGRASTAARLAYDLKTAESCNAQLEWLDRAIAEGDSRTLAILSYNVDGAKRGCGPRRRSPCRPKCKDMSYQKRVRPAISKIKARLAKP